LKLNNLLRFINYHKYFEKVQAQELPNSTEENISGEFYSLSVFMRSEGSFLGSHQSVTGHNLQPDESNPYLHTPVSLQEVL
jgi:hypothetical protein